MRRVAVYAGTRNVYGAMTTAAKSLLWHTRMDRVVFLIEDPILLPDELPRVIETIDVSRQRFFPAGGPNFSNRWTYMTLMRLALPELLPEETRALWLDVDTIVTGDIGDLFETDMRGCPLSAAREPPCSRPGRIYYNAGVLLMDLQLMREDGTARRLIDRVNRQRLDFGDQDAINIECAGRILDMDPVYNASDWTARPAEARILHYAAVRDYQNDALFRAWAARGWPEI